MGFEKGNISGTIEEKQESDIEIELKANYRLKVIETESNNDGNVRISTNDWNVAFTKLIDFGVKKFKAQNLTTESHDFILNVSNITVNIIDQNSMEKAIIEAVKNNASEIIIEIKVFFLCICLRSAQF